MSKKKPVQFNPYQKAVVDFRKGFAVAMAAPGSGKTEVVISRIRALISEGIQPKEILSLTFTKEGAREMTERANLKDVTEKVFSTFHSWSLGFIKKEALALPFAVKKDWHGNPNPLCLPLDAARTIAQICRRLPNVKWKDAQSYISLMKRRGITPSMAYQLMEHDKEEVMIIAYEKYEAALREKGVMDFDSIIIETANLLEKREDVRARNQYKYIQVDEAQDTDAVQWRTIKMLGQRHGNVLAVGDENQGMYSWRGSESNLQTFFCNKFPGAKVFALPVNYRSSAAIVEYCKGIAPIQNETVLQLQTPNARGVEPVFRLYPREDEEATAVINGCTDLGNTAVLARTNRQLAAFENECGTRNLRYKLLGKSGFWGQNEVKDALAIIGSVVMPTDNNILRMLTARCEMTKFIRKADTRDCIGTPTALTKFQECYTEGGQAGFSLSRIMTRFDCGDQSQNEIVRNIGHTLHSLRGEIKSLNGEAGMRRILERFGVLSAYDEDDDKDENVDNDPRDNVLKLIEYAAKKGSVAQFYEWVQRLQRALRARTNCLVLGTIHSAKGKEWDTVYVVGVNEGILPHEKGDEQEERQIYFVACSRAAHRLHVSANGIPSILIRDKVAAPGAVVETIDPWEGFTLLQQ